MKLRVKSQEVEVRAGTVADVPLLLSFIRSMAEFEKLEVSTNEEILRKSLFGNNPAANTLLAFVDGEPAAYAVYFFSFSTMVGKRGLWLEDLYITPKFRGKGIAKALMSYLAEIAIENDCGRFEWITLDWNKRAIGFFESFGAKVQEDWRIFRLDEDDLVWMAGRIMKLDDHG